MIGQPYILELNEINKIAEGVKLAEAATDLEFKTSYKLSRLNYQITPAQKAYSKLKTQATRTYQASEKKQEDLEKLNASADGLETQEETIYIPEFALSEFVYDDKAPTEKKGKLKIPQAALNRLIRFVKDDLTKIPEVKVEEKKFKEELEEAVQE
jgi:hypothetical protein